MFAEYLLYMCSSHFHMPLTKSCLLNNNVSEIKLFERVVFANGTGVAYLEFSFLVGSKGAS